MLVEYEKRGQVAIVRMNRPDQLNAINAEMRLRLAETWNAFEADPDARVAILTGTGRAFTSGVDVKESIQLKGEMRVGAAPIAIPDRFLFQNDLTKPVIAAVNGLSVGLGLIMSVLTADLCIAAESAYFQAAEVARGMMVGWDWGWEAQWPRAVAMEVALGTRLSARRAYDAGLIVEVVPDDELMDAAMTRAQRILEVPPGIVRANRELVRRLTRPLPPEIETLAAQYAAAFRSTEDAKEAVRSWIEKRKPIFRDA